VPADLNGARVLLTGASGGIGNAIARALHQRGSSLLITGRREEMLQTLQSELGDRVEPLVADLASADDVRMLIDRAAGVDVLVANAGLPASGRLDDFTPEQIDRAVDVNLRAPIQMARALIPAMLERGRGHVVLVSSLAGKVAQSGSSIYSATKFGLRGFGFALHDELRGTGVDVTIVYPGFIRDAGMFAESGVKLPPGTGTKTPEQVAEAVIKGIEKGRPEIDVAPLSFKFGGRRFGAAPGVVTTLTRLGGGEKVARGLEAGQRNKR
jgi:short-subunit dehydrogenase